MDVPLTACDGSLLICAIDGEFQIKRIHRTHPQTHLINLDNGRREALPEDDDGYNSSHAISGVITYIIKGDFAGQLIVVGNESCRNRAVCKSMIAADWLTSNSASIE